MGFTGPTSTWPVPGARQQWEQHRLKSQQSSITSVADLHVLCTAANDYYFDFVSQKQTLNVEIAVNNVLASVHALVHDIVTKSNPKNLLICNLYPLSLTPFATGSNITSLMQDIEKLHNSKLATAMQELQKQTKRLGSHTTLTVLPFHETFSEAILGMPEHKQPCFNPEETESALCDKPAKYAFFDTFHPTARTHELAAAALLKTFKQALKL
jgi:phospholipase/lecithinase/hemolysin